MEYIYAAMLLHSAKQKVEETSVKKVLEGAGIKPDEARVKALCATLEGINIDEVLKQASQVPVQVAAPVEKKEEKKEEKKVEEAAAGLGALFG